MTSVRFSSFVGALMLSGAAHAGMPSPTWVVSRLGGLRLQSLSFFLMGILFVALCARGLWNSLRADLPILPRLSFKSSLGFVLLWGVAFVLVLTMISGARELMTPGAWKPNGATYSLADPASQRNSASQQGGDDEGIAARREKLEALRFALWNFALQRDGRFPANDQRGAIAAELWRAPDPSGMEYRYSPMTRDDAAPQILVMEPAIFGSVRLALLTNGEIISLRSESKSSWNVAPGLSRTEPATAEIPGASP